jgi:hypothetical protein
MKRLFIFFALIPIAFSGCAQQKTTLAENPDTIIRAEAEEWRSTPPGEDDFTEHGIDLIIEIPIEWSDHTFNFIVYDGRKSFPVAIDSTKQNTLLIRARVLFNSVLLAETSERTNLTDRLVFQKANGETDFIPIHSWTQKPLSYK